MYGYITKLHRQRAEVKPKYAKAKIRHTGQEKNQHRE